MAKKSSSLKTAKKKGPKGKRARAKAKLERQWGEEAINVEEHPRAAALQLRGKQRVLDQEKPPRTNNNKQQQSSTSIRQGYNDDDVAVEDYEKFGQESDDDDEKEDGGGDAKAVSSFVEQLRRNHRKELRHQQQPSLSSELGHDESMKEDDNISDNDDDDDDANAMDDDDDTAQVDPFTARFGISSEVLLTQKKDPVTHNKPRKVALPFVKEGTTLQLSQWPPLQDGESSSSSSSLSSLLSPSLPTGRPEWRRYARRLWQSQKPLLRQQQQQSTPLLSSSIAQVLYPLMATYMDICQTIPVKREETVQSLYASHILNHVWTSRQRVYQHTKELKQLDNEEEEDIEAKQDPKFRDQGFTRPTVLVLMPTRGICYQFIQTLLKLLYSDDDDAGRAAALGDRFVTEYGPPENVDTDPRRQAVLQQKGKEWLSLFGDDVNDDDDFKLGVALHLHEKQKRPTLKLYSDFSKSDLILASPLGLKMLAAKQSGGDDDEDNQDVDAEVSAPDFLSSIEICWVSHAHVLMMQNWDHVTDVLDWINQRPKDTADTDFARVRPYFLEDDDKNGVSSAAWRQFILTASYMDPCMKAAFGKHAKSHAGAARISRKTSWTEAALTKITVPTRQVFQRIIVKSVQEQADARLAYFGKHVLPKISKDQQPFTLIFVPSYLEFVSLRNYLLKREADYFVSVTEYSRNSETSRGRARFGQGRKALMLYTGRAHFFHRHIIRGVRHVIFYGLPTDPEVYRQVVDWCEDESTQTQFSKTVPESSVLALYTAYEAHALERIVGHGHCSRMTKGEKTTFLFAA